MPVTSIAKAYLRLRYPTRATSIQLALLAAADVIALTLDVKLQLSDELLSVLSLLMLVGKPADGTLAVAVAPVAIHGLGADTGNALADGNFFVKRVSSVWRTWNSCGAYWHWHFVSMIDEMYEEEVTYRQGLF